MNKPAQFWTNSYVFSEINAVLWTIRENISLLLSMVYAPVRSARSLLEIAGFFAFMQFANSLLVFKIAHLRGDRVPACSHVY